MSCDVIDEIKIRKSSKMVFKRNGKPGPARSKPGGGILAKDSLVCIHCHIRVKFGGSLPYTEYEKHLRKCSKLYTSYIIY